jgi:hypothetical protein
MPTNGAEQAAFPRTYADGTWISVAQDHGTWRATQSFYDRGHTMPLPGPNGNGNGKGHGKGHGRSIAP